MKYRTALTLLVTALIASASFGGEGMDFKWKKTETTFALVKGEKVIWQLNFDKKEGKPYLHPVSTVDGEVLTWLRPADHVWHRAIWFSWKYINKLNYWEENKKTGLSQGRTEIKDIKITPKDDFSAVVEMDLAYRPPEKETIMNEKRVIIFTKPDEKGCYRIDREFIWTAETDLVLDRTPIPGEKGGKGWGGYAGYSVRIAKETTEWQVLDSEGRKDMQTHGKPARWMDFSLKTAGGREAGIAILDHPNNPRHPSPWYLAKNGHFGYFSPAILFREKMELKKGEKLTLKYRTLIHPERTDKDLLEKEYKMYMEGR